jgi:hypothetical protein
MDILHHKRFAAKTNTGYGVIISLTVLKEIMD